MKSEVIQEISLMDALVIAIQYFKKKALLIISIPITGCLLGFFAHTQDRGMYGSSMLFRSEKLKRTELTHILKQLKSSPTLGSIPLGRPTADWFFEYTRESLIANNNYIRITLKSPDSTIYPLFSKSIVQYLEESPVAIQRKEELEGYYSSLISAVDSELDQLEKWRISSKDSALSEISNTMVDLQHRKMQYAQALEQKSVIVLVSDFTAPVKLGNSRKLSCFLGFLLGVGMLILILIAQYFIEYYKINTKKHSV